MRLPRKCTRGYEADFPSIYQWQVGNNLCVFGGVGIWIGGGGMATALAIGQHGIGQNLFVGGGVMIMVR